ncbi:MAG: thioredoxin family protein [Halobacteriota archaeon]|jgi:LPXTG-motif cell wall-anchored protein
MKKQIGLIALSTLIVACVAFSGVASAQSSGVQVYFFESPYCGVCTQVRPLMESAAAQTGAHVTYYDMSTSLGAGIGKANGVTETPTIVIQGGQTLMGSVTEQQIVAAIQAASGNQVAKAAATPAVVKATPTPYVAPKVVKATPTPYVAPKVVKATPTPYVAPKVVKATPTPYVAPKVVTAAEPRTQPSIQVVTATQTPATSTQTVPEFSLLGLGAPALLIGAIYLFLRRR